MQNEQKRQKEQKKTGKSLVQKSGKPIPTRFWQHFFCYRSFADLEVRNRERQFTIHRDRSRIVVQLILGTRAGLVSHISPLIELVCRKFDISSYLFHSLCLLSFITHFERTEDKKNCHKKIKHTEIDRNENAHKLNF